MQSRGLILDDKEGNVLLAQRGPDTGADAPVANEDEMVRELRRRFVGRSRRGRASCGASLGAAGASARFR